MKIFKIVFSCALIIFVSGCSSHTQRAEEHIFFTTAVFQALWYDATSSPSFKFPTGAESADQILITLPEGDRQRVLDDALRLWHEQKNAAAKINQ